MAPEGYVIVPNKNAHIIIKQGDQSAVLPTLKDNRGGSNLSIISEESKQQKNTHQPTHQSHTPPQTKATSNTNLTSDAPPLISAPSEDAIDTIEMGTSSKFYWKDLDASAKRSSWKAMEIASVIGILVYGGFVMYSVWYMM